MQPLKSMASTRFFIRTASAAQMKSSRGSISPPQFARTSCFRISAQSLEGQIRVDCRLNCFACGILPTFANMRRENPGDVWKCPDVKSPASTNPLAHVQLETAGCGGLKSWPNTNKEIFLARLMHERDKFEFLINRIGFSRAA